jgi:hypothetical protein
MNAQRLLISRGGRSCTLSTLSLPNYHITAPVRHTFGWRGHVYGPEDGMVARPWRRLSDCHSEVKIAAETSTGNVVAG